MLLDKSDLHTNHARETKEPSDLTSTCEERIHEKLSDLTSTCERFKEPSDLEPSVLEAIFEPRYREIHNYKKSIMDILDDGLIAKTNEHVNYFIRKKSTWEQAELIFENPELYYLLCKLCNEFPYNSIIMVDYNKFLVIDISTTEDSYKIAKEKYWTWHRKMMYI